jgi:hypothetical protein
MPVVVVYAMVMGSFGKMFLAVSYISVDIVVGQEHKPRDTVASVTDLE